MIGQSLTVPTAEWHGRFMRLAVNVSMWSKDPDKQVGALVVSPDRRRFSAGYNGLPWGMPDDPEVLCNKELKNALTIHAEQNAIANAPFDLEGWTIYSTTAPCLHCALAIRQHRLSHLVCAQTDPESRWADEQHQAKTMLENLGVQVTWVCLEHLFG